MKKIFLLMLLILPITLVNAADKDIELIRKRFAEVALNPNAPVATQLVQERMKTLTAEGFWPDINYEDTRNVAFQHTEHLKYMVAMARAYKVPKSPLKGNKELRKKLLAAIDFWTKHDFICGNWWNNQIGTPSAMLNILYIIDKELGQERAEKMLKIAMRANMDASGARPSGDRCKVASLYAQAVLWKRDIPEVKKMIKLISEQMRYYTEEEFRALLASNKNFLGGGRGLQPDFSFHHRMDRVNNTLSYGSGHASSFTDWAIKVYDTQYRFPEESIRLLADYYLDGMCKQMAFGKQSDPGIMNRDIARPSSGTQSASNYIPNAILQMTDYRKEEIQHIIDLRQGKSAEVSSFAKTFFNTEYFAFQRPTWYTSVRMYSTRNRSMEEPYNGEGFTNHYRADGTNYLTITGREYANIYPTYDFRKIPGTTVMQATEMPGENQVQQRGLTDFVGGVDDGLYGAAAFDFISPIDAVSAKKAWFFFDDAYICLGTDIAHKGKEEIFTTMNQCYLNGDVTVGAEGVNGKLEKGDHEINNVTWVNHANVGYVFPQQSNSVGIKNNAVEGTWTRLNRQTTVNKSKVTNDIFYLYINHGKNLSNGRYTYIVLPNADAAQTAAYAQHNDITVIANNSSMQAVKNEKTGIAYAVMYASGILNISDRLSVYSETPAMLLVRFNSNKITELVVSDPSRKNSALHLSVTADGKTKEYVVKLPQAELGGSSVKVKL
ncbi:MAG: polysaccharide lyase family 8 super-sandwich domain-containing protein [Bacteroidales bacterium]|nr:polysaccharide lyase family 8 super-sandwich domain-containing protein [Bacteroidales bacterium]